MSFCELAWYCDAICGFLSPKDVMLFSFFIILNKGIECVIGTRYISYIYSVFRDKYKKLKKGLKFNISVFYWIMVMHTLITLFIVILIYCIGWNIITISNSQIFKPSNSD